MALFKIDMFSPSFGFYVKLNVTVPTPWSEEIFSKKDDSYLKHGTVFPVLYLLHGANSGYDEWLRMTNIERYAQEAKVIVVMPDGANSFYIDMERGSCYETYITKELPEFIEKMFPVAEGRENRFIGGCSMGGYGAFRLALKYPERYAAAFSLSGVLNIPEAYDRPRPKWGDGPLVWENVFGDDIKLHDTEFDILWLLKKRVEEGNVPRLLHMIGNRDVVRELTAEMVVRMQETDPGMIAVEDEGVHNWAYWDAHVPKAIDFLLMQGEFEKEV